MDRIVSRASMLLLASAALLITMTGTASADTQPTTTGQKLSIDGDCGLVDSHGVSRGTATLTAGSVSLTSVTIAINGHDVTVSPDSDGHFKASVPLSPKTGTVNCVGEATTSDGTTATYAISVFIDRVAELTPPGSSEPHETGTTRELPNTGPSGPRTLGPIGLAMVLLGSALAWRHRRSRVI